MKATKIKQIRRRRRKQGIRKRVVGLPQCPRLTVYRSLHHIYAQVIDDLAGRTLAAASSVKDVSSGGGNKSGASAVGKAIAKKAKDAGVERVALDRNGFRYHGRIKALADAAREMGLKF